jgi:hypothetical protein
VTGPRRLLIAAAAALIGALAPATPAYADGDPASDVLLGQSVFYPYSPAVSAAMQRGLDATTAAAARAGFPIKVALIESPVDLGAVPSFFGRPQPYAQFLDQEISIVGTLHPPLLVVMPAGYGVAGLPAASTTAAAQLPKPADRRTDGLARAAVAAVRRLAAAAGHPLPRVSVAAGATASSAGGPGAVVLVLLALAAVCAAAAVLLIRARHSSRR